MPIGIPVFNIKMYCQYHGCLVVQKKQQEGGKIDPEWEHKIIV